MQDVTRFSFFFIMKNFRWSTALSTFVAPAMPSSFAASPVFSSLDSLVSDTVFTGTVSVFKLQNFNSLNLFFFPLQPRHWQEQEGRFLKRLLLLSFCVSISVAFVGVNKPVKTRCWTAIFFFSLEKVRQLKKNLLEGDPVCPHVGVQSHVNRQGKGNDG